MLNSEQDVILFTVNRILTDVDNIKYRQQTLIDQIDPLSDQLERIESLLKVLTSASSGDTKMVLDDFMVALNAKLAAEENQVTAVTSLLSDVVTQLRANVGDPVAMQAILDRVDADAAKLANAVTANTATPAKTTPVENPTTEPANTDTSKTEDATH